MTRATIHIDKGRSTDSVANILVTIRWTTPKTNVEWFSKSTNNVEKQYSFAFIYSNIQIMETYYNNYEEKRYIDHALTPKIFRRSTFI